MATFTRSDDLQGAEFVDANLRGARFVRADLSGVVILEEEREHHRYAVRDLDTIEAEADDGPAPPGFSGSGR